MEHSVFRRKLDKNKIQPPELMSTYTEKIISDIKMIDVDYYVEFINLDTSIENFEKFGMSYSYAKNNSGVFLNPRPNKDTLRNFYINSNSRSFWLKNILKETQKKRVDEIILPHLNWVKEIMSQYYNKDLTTLEIIEFNPVHWLYLDNINNFFNTNYSFYDLFFPVDKIPSPIKNFEIVNELETHKYDCCFLFESIDRALNPVALLSSVLNALKVNGICFISCLLSSGFEAKSLGKASNVFFPPEKMNLFSYEGIIKLINENECFEIIEFSTPSLLDLENVLTNLQDVEGRSFISYMLDERNDEYIKNKFKDFLQENRLGSSARIAIKKVK